MSGARIAAVVLAAGAATRFGGRKQLAELEGRPLLEHALAAALAGPADPVLVVLGAEARDVAAGIDLGAARPVLCADWQLGQGASLRAGLAALPEDVEAALVTLGDEPYLPAAAPERLVAARAAGTPAMRATYDGRPGHPVLIERELFPLLTAAGDPPSPGQVLRRAGVVGVPCEDLGTVADVDTPAQLAELAARRR